MKTKINKDLVDDLSDCGKDHYCTLKELLKISATFDPRFLVQLKCVDFYKHDDIRSPIDIGWSEAMVEWAKLGYAEIFADVYRKAIDNNEIIHCKVLYEHICDIFEKNKT